MLCYVLRIINMLRFTLNCSVECLNSSDYFLFCNTTQKDEELLDLLESFIPFSTNNQCPLDTTIPFLLRYLN